MYLYVLKCCKVILDMLFIIMGILSDVDGGMNKFFWVLFFFLYWYKMIFVIFLKNKYRSKNIFLNKFDIYYRCK